MKKIIVVALVVIFVSIIAYIIWIKPRLSSSPITVFATQEECERLSGSACKFQMCDYKCPPDFKKGWVNNMKSKVFIE
jgi:hypothetical protein